MSMGIWFQIKAGVIGVLLCLTVVQFANGTVRKELPLEAFYRMPALGNVKISPSGKYLAALKNVGEYTVLIVRDLDTGDTNYPVKSDNVDFRFNWIEWANDDYILMSLRFESRVNSSQKYTQSRLLSIHAHKGGKMRTMVRLDDGDHIPQFQDNVISLLPDDPEHILIGVDKHLWGRQSVLRVKVKSGSSRNILKARSDIRWWVADRSGDVRLGWGYDDKKQKATIKVKDPRTDKWVVAWEYVVYEEPPIGILGFGKDNTELFILADYDGRKAVYRVDLSKEGYPKELVLSDPVRDINGSLIYVGKENRVVGLYYSGASNESVFWDKEFQAFQRGLDKALPEASNYIVSMSEDARSYILFSQNKVAPGAFYYGNRDEKSLVKIADQYPELTPGVLVEKEHRIYKARDGLEIEGYLSLPHDFSGKPTATIIYPHGGPMSNDGVEFDSFSSFFVNRGYAVFQPNYRGSTGRGHDFQMMAKGGFGLQMQDDLEDAVNYLVKEGIADPNKLCIAGGSYGGYAALMGVAKTPDLYKCAISFAGISDLKKLYDSLRFFMDKNRGRAQLGNDKKQLKATSPLRLAENIKAPVLLIHGLDDTTVSYRQSKIMANKLKSLSKTYEYIELEDGSHYLDYLPHRKITFEAMEKFLDTYLPVN